MKGNRAQKCDAFKDCKIHCDWTANWEKWDTKRLWITNVQKHTWSKWLRAKIRFHVWPFSLKESTKKWGSFESHVSNKIRGWGSWHMRLHASKCTECLPSFWESCICLKIKRLKMILSSQTPLIRKHLRRAYATICTLDRAKENQGILRTSQRVELGATRSNRQGLPL